MSDETMQLDIEITYAEWRARARALFGDDEMQWRFVCPVCKTMQSVADYKAAGAPPSAVGYSCVGRWMESPRRMLKPDGRETRTSGPCDYTSGGLFRFTVNTVRFPDGKTSPVFAFAPDEPKTKKEGPRDA